MFGLMKNLIKDNLASTDTLTLAELHTGCVLGFGFMPQKSVSGKRIPVSELNSYLFDADSFLSYRLANDNTDINLIVADDDDPTGTYLALSQRIEPRLFDSIFPGKPPKSWFALKEGATLEVKPPVLGSPQGWLATRYTLAVTTTGRFLEGDYRMRKPADRSRLSREFDYVLLVDEDNEYAIEAEKNEDGMINVFATIYRPATDIGEITRAPKSLITSSVETIPHVSPAENPKLTGTLSGSSQAAIIESSKPILVESAPKPAVAEVEKPPVVTEVAKKAEAQEAPKSAPDAIMDVTDMAAAQSAKALPEESSLDAIAAALVELKEQEDKKEAEEKKAEHVSLPELPPANAAQPESVAETKPAEPETKESELKEPEAKEPEAKAVEAKEPETKEPEVKVVEAKEPESKELEIKEPEPKETEAKAIEVKELEVKEPEVAPAVPEAKVSEPVTETAPPEPVLQEAQTIEVPGDPPVVAEFVPGIVIPEVTVRSKFGRIQPALLDKNSAPDTLACDTRLAGRLIDEAQRNQMLLSELIRKVIDLPARVQDKVLIPFELDELEIAELARRYNLLSANDEAVKEHIMEELRRFVGGKK